MPKCNSQPTVGAGNLHSMPRSRSNRIAADTAPPNAAASQRPRATNATTNAAPRTAASQRPRATNATTTAAPRTAASRQRASQRLQRTNSAANAASQRLQRANSANENTLEVRGRTRNPHFREPIFVNPHAVLGVPENLPAPAKGFKWQFNNGMWNQVPSTKTNDLKSRTVNVEIHKRDGTVITKPLTLPISQAPLPLPRDFKLIRQNLKWAFEDKQNGEIISASTRKTFPRELDERWERSLREIHRDGYVSQTQDGRYVKYKNDTTGYVINNFVLSDELPLDLKKVPSGWTLVLTRSNKWGLEKDGQMITGNGRNEHGIPQKWFDFLASQR